MRNKELAAILAAGLVLGNWGAAEAAAQEEAPAEEPKAEEAPAEQGEESPEA